ncbi:MAG: isopentenyl transferase family protein [Bryobacteraceae bacterium]
MKHVVILGPGGSGKSTLAVRLGKITGLPVIELDKVFWLEGLVAMPRDQWAQVQMKLVKDNQWIMDGDLGPHDAVEVRLRSADTVIFLNFSFVRCAWRAMLRSRERSDFWLWLLRYRRRSRPLLMTESAAQAPTATLYMLRDPEAVKRFIAEVEAAGH